MSVYDLVMFFWDMTPDGGASYWVNLGGGWWGGVIYQL